MSSTTRKKKNNSIQKTARSRSRPKKKKSKNQNKRASTNNMRIGRASTPKQRASPNKYFNHQSIASLSNSQNGYHHDDNLLDIHNRDSPPPSPSSRPTHKKNALSSFLSVFSTFSHTNKRRKESSQSDTIESMSDLELLKRLKRRILDVLSKILDPKLLRRVKSELKPEVWEHEYSELKKRLSTHDIHTATMRQQLASAQSLKQLTSIHNTTFEEDDDDEDVREMATFLLSEYFDQPEAGNTGNYQYINVQRDSFKNKAPIIHIPTIKEHTSDNEQVYNFNEESDNDDEKKAVVTPFDDTPVDEEKEHDFEYLEQYKQVKYNTNHNKIIDNNAYDNKKRKKHKKKSNKSKKGPKDVENGGKRSRKSSRSRRFSPRPISEYKAKASFDNIPDKAITIRDKKHKKQSTAKQRMKHKAHRIEIRNKFRRGVRKAMLVNAWSNINSNHCPNNDHDAEHPRDKLTLSNITSESMISDHLLQALSKVGTWDFDPFEFIDTPEIGGKCLVYTVWYLFDKHDLFKVFPQISPKKFMNFLVKIEDGYINNPYHNKIHAADVVSNVAYYLNHTQFFAKHTSSFDKFTAILSAAVHDVGHDGNNNAYHITTQSDLAITYNDISVLENYHVATTFRILKRSDCNWYPQLSKPVQKYLRNAMIDIVLATDMKFHNQKLAQLTGLVAILKQQLNKKILLRDNRDSISSAASLMSIPIIPTYSPNIEPSHSQSSLMNELFIDKPKCLSDFPLYKYKADPNDVVDLLKTEISPVIITENADPRVIDVTDERRFVLCWLVHLCDISNCAKSLKSGRKWAVRLMTEFFKQGDRERTLDLEVSAMMDRRRSSTPQGQIGFIKFILRPSYKMFARLVPEAQKPCDILNENLEYWQIQQKLMTQQRKKRARSVGSINQAPVLMMMQDQLKMLEDKQESREHTHSRETDDEDDTQSMRSVKIHEESEAHATQHTNKKIVHHKQVGFKEILVIESNKPLQESKSMDGRYCKSPEIIYMQDNEIQENEEEEIVGKHKRNEPSGYTNYSIDSIDSTSTPTLGGKQRAHSIHVSIPTSQKQIQSQPQPFSEFLSELRKSYKEEEHHSDAARKKRKQRTANLIHIIKQQKPKVKQSVSVPVVGQPGTVIAEITVSDIDDEDEATPKPMNSNNNKQVFDVV